jgi:hypothetical protein
MFELMVKQMFFKSPALVLAIWTEMTPEDLTIHTQKILSSPSDSLGHKFYEKPLKIDGHRIIAKFYERGTGLRILCFAQITEKRYFGPVELRELLVKLEKRVINCLKLYFKSQLRLKGPIWIHVYPIWYVKETSPQFHYVREILPKYGKYIDELLNLVERYPVTNTTPELPTERILRMHEIFDIDTNREALYVVLRGMTLIIGASQRNAIWFLKLIISRIEPRPFISFGRYVPKEAEKKPWSVFKVRLVSAKGWYGDMTKIEDTLERQKLLGYFSEIKKSVKTDVLFALSGVLIGITRAMEVIKPSIFWLPLSVFFLFCALLTGISKVWKISHPKFSRILWRVVEPLFYFCFVLFILNVFFDLDLLFHLSFSWNF